MSTSPKAIALVVRILIALLTRTYFQPDEYFQSLEPAHALVFGYGHLTWEWLTPQPIRSILYPALNVPVFWALKVLRLDNARFVGDTLLIAGPRIVHGAFAAATDIWLCELARQVLGERYVPTAFWLSLTSTFHALSLSRSFSNSLETSLATIAFSQFPWDASYHRSPSLINRMRIRKSLIFASLACAVRPTSAIIWIFLFSRIFWILRSHRKMALSLAVDAIAIGGSTLVAIFTFDSLYYQHPTFTPLNFLLTNMSSVSSFYGGNSWHFYLSAALPILCTTSLPFVLLGMRSAVVDHTRNTGALKCILQAIAWTIGIYTVSRHKEWRFIHPLLPLLHLFAAKWLVDQSASSKPAVANVKSLSQKIFPYPSSINWKYAYLILSTTPVSVYLVMLYCSGPISAMGYLRGLPRQELIKGVGVLMPCHSIPGSSYLHREELARGGLWSLGCEPPLQGQMLSSYVDQTDVFYKSPLIYLRTYFPEAVNTSFPKSPLPASPPGWPAVKSNGRWPWAHEWPGYLIFFGELLGREGVQAILEEKGYSLVWKGGRPWEGEGKRLGGVHIWKWMPS